mmetsp:Transcript_106955/g.190155  ORF Transcript_106955/g.190155 Transcript_106955/m.190155 type:complete len:240 (+) Transcript_106955:55-774(+)
MTLHELKQLLEAIPLDFTDESEEEVELSAEVEVGQSETRNKPLVALKRAVRHEDEDWIKKQGAIEKAELKGAISVSTNVFRDWRIHGMTADEWISRQATAKQSKSIFCMSRIWGGGWGGQCTHTCLLGSAYCETHEQQLKRQGYLTHGRIDGDIPTKKRKEMDQAQAKMMKTAGTSQTMTDGQGFDEASWRAMARGDSESARAYFYRTGQVVDAGKTQKVAGSEEHPASRKKTRKKMPD